MYHRRLYEDSVFLYCENYRKNIMTHEHMNEMIQLSLIFFTQQSKANDLLQRQVHAQQPTPKKTRINELFENGLTQLINSTCSRCHNPIILPHLHLPLRTYDGHGRCSKITKKVSIRHRRMPRIVFGKMYCFVCKRDAKACKRLA